MIDQAFDRISKDFMIHTFKNFGCGPDFVKWVSVLMADTKSCCLLRLVIRIFCRRGWNASGLPFFTTSLCSWGRTACNKNTTLWEHKRIQLSESKTWPLGKYHKNCTIYRLFNVVKKTKKKQNEQDMQQALGILAEFSAFSGLEINRMKSEAMWLGSKQNCTDDDDELMLNVLRCHETY